jgi:hypothetical protein
VNESPTKAHWLIQGFDGLSKIYERRIDARHISEESVRLLLRTLVAKAALTPDEIVGAHVNKRAHDSNQLLGVARDGPRMRLTCGESPYFTAVYHRN